MDIRRTLPPDVERPNSARSAAPEDLADAFSLAAVEGMVQLDERRQIVRFNRSAERILGYTSHSVVGTAFDSLLHASNRAQPFVPPSPDEPLVTTLVLRDSRGDAVPVRARSALIASGGGCVVAFYTKQRHEEIEQLKSELVSTVSHELKTPLAAIKAYTATLRQNPGLYEQQRDEFLAVVEHEADRLSRLIEDMLLVARVETAQMLRVRTWVDLDRLLDECLAGIAVDQTAHPVQRTGTNVRISGDPDRLRDVFRNVIENAVKYSPDGGPIEIAAHETPDRCTVTVRDRGIGIAEEHVPYIFDRFYRAEDEITSRVGGSGLGLYIVQALVRAHGGTVRVETTPGEGTAFELVFPVRA